MRGVADYVVVYDISDDKERSHVDKILKGFGFRYQKSVFECRMSMKMRDDLVKILGNLNIQTGYIKIYKRDWDSKNYVIGNAPQENIDDFTAFII